MKASKDVMMGKLSVKVSTRSYRSAGRIKKVALCSDCSGDCGGSCKSSNRKL